MAKKPTNTVFQQQEKTYQGFITVGKWSVLSLALTMVALYFFIVTVQPAIGWVLVAAAVVLPVFKVVSSMMQS